MTIVASHRPVRELAPNRYICSRCGIERTTVSTRPRPELCRDCKSAVRVVTSNPGPAPSARGKARRG